MMVTLSLMRSLFVFLVALLSFHQSWAWRTRSNFVASSSSSSSHIPRCCVSSVVLRLLRGGDDTNNNGDGGKELYESNTSGFGPIIRTGGFLSHVYVLSKDDDLDTDVSVLKKYLSTTATKCNMIFDPFPNYLRAIDFTEGEEDVRKTLVCARVCDRPMHLCSRERRDDYCKLVGIKQVEDDDGHFYTIYCLTVLDSFGDKEKNILEDLKAFVGSDLGYVGHMLSPPPSTAEEFIVNMEKEPSNQLNEKIGFFDGEEMSVKEWITRLRQTGGNMVSKPELEKFAIFSDIDTAKETFGGDDDPKDIEVTPEFLKTFFQGKIWEYPNWEFHATQEYLFVHFGEDRGAVFQWKEPLEINPDSLAPDGINGIVNVIENDGETFYQITSR